MFCTNCGKEIGSSSRLCGHCGRACVGLAEQTQRPDQWPKAWITAAAVLLHGVSGFGLAACLAFYLYKRYRPNPHPVRHFVAWWIAVQCVWLVVLVGLVAMLRRDSEVANAFAQDAAMAFFLLILAGAARLVFHKKVRVRGVFTQCGPQERRPSAELGQAVPTAGDEDYGFLFRYAASIVYGVFLAALFLSMAASVAHFSSGRVLFGLWCLAAIPILPKSALGLILIIARDTPLALMNLPMIFYSVFPGTTTRYRSDNLVFEVLYHRVRNGYLREILWLAVGLVPLLAAAVYTRRASP